MKCCLQNAILLIFFPPPTHLIWSNEENASLILVLLWVTINVGNLKPSYNKHSWVSKGPHRTPVSKCVTWTQHLHIQPEASELQDGNVVFSVSDGGRIGTDQFVCASQTDFTKKQNTPWLHQSLKFHTRWDRRFTLCAISRVIYTNGATYTRALLPRPCQTTTLSAEEERNRKKKTKKTTSISSPLPARVRKNPASLSCLSEGTSRWSWTLRLQHTAGESRIVWRSSSITVYCCFIVLW